MFLTAEREASGDGHVKFYTIEEYGRLLAEVGLSIESQEPLPHFISSTKQLNTKILSAESAGIV